MKRLFLTGIFFSALMAVCSVTMVGAAPATPVGIPSHQPDGVESAILFNSVSIESMTTDLAGPNNLTTFYQFLPLVSKPPAPSIVLWDQPASMVNVEVYADQQFPDASNYNIYQADDFLVGSSGWVVKEFFIPGGLYSEGTSLTLATLLKFQVYADNAGIPAGDPVNGGAVWSISLPPGDAQVALLNGADGRLSNVKLQLTTPIYLPAGRYWFVFYPVMFSATGGQYGRAVSDTVNGLDAVVMNPGGGFNFPLTWTSIQDTSTWSMVQQDLAFRLEGQVP